MLEHDVRPSDCITLVDCDQIVQQKVEIGTRQDRSMSFGYTCMPKTTQIVVSCDPEFY